MPPFMKKNCTESDTFDNYTIKLEGQHNNADMYVQFYLPMNLGISPKTGLPST